MAESLYLKGSTNRYKHRLVPLTPLNEESQTKAYRPEFDDTPKILFDEQTRLMKTVIFCGGPTLTVGEQIPQINMTLKEIAPAYDAEGNFLYNALIFE